jgi:hypothetical protein
MVFFAPPRRQERQEEKRRKRRKEGGKETQLAISTWFFLHRQDAIDKGSVFWKSRTPRGREGRIN